MDLERLKIWRDALIEAEAKGRTFDLGIWVRERRGPEGCGFTACLAGDLALYEPARALGLSYQFHSGPGAIFYRDGSGDRYAVQNFLDATTPDDEAWVADTVVPYSARMIYGKPASAITRADGLARIEAKIAEVEAARCTA